MLSPLMLSGSAAFALALFGGAMTPIDQWYLGLAKPRWQPPRWVFAPAWTVILALWAASADIAWRAAGDAVTRRGVIALFAINALGHAAWSPLFFRARRPDWALGEVALLWASLVALIVGLWPIAPVAALLIAPYFAWVSFAAWLNYTIVRLNAPFGRAHDQG